MGEHDLVGVDVQKSGKLSPGFDESGLVGHLMEQVGIQFDLALQIQCSLENWSWRGPVGALERSEHKWMGFQRSPELTVVQIGVLRVQSRAGCLFQLLTERRRSLAIHFLNVNKSVCGSHRKRRVGTKQGGSMVDSNGTVSLFKRGPRNGYVVTVPS